MLNLTAHGNIGRDPELRESGQSQVANFSLGCRTGQESTTWINCAVWGKRAETVMKFLKKGSKVTVVGSGKLRTYEKKDGTQGQSLELNVTDFTLPLREAPADDFDI